MLLFSVHPKPKGRKVKKMNFVTLKELKKMVPAVEEGKRPPSLKKILEEGTEVLLRKLMENHAEVVVYKNGYPRQMKTRWVKKKEGLHGS